MSTDQPVWFEPPDLLGVAELAKNSLIERLGIEVLDVGPDWLSGRMPVDRRTCQPFGVLHGGASVALAETLASLASTFVVDKSRFFCVGLEVNANHLRPAREGYVQAVVRAVQLGKRIHVWDVRINDDRQRPVCISRVTMAVVEGRTG